MAFGDILAGMATAGHEHRRTLLQMDYEKKKALADRYGKLAEDPSYPEEARTEFLNRALQIHTFPAEKKLPKEWEKMMISVQPPTGPRVPQDQNIPFGSSAHPLGQQFPEIPPPTPPREMRSVNAPLPFNEQLDRMRQTEEMKAGIERKTTAYKAGIPKVLSPMVTEDAEGNRIRTYPIQKGVTDEAGDPVLDEAGFPQLEFSTTDINEKIGGFADRRDDPFPIATAIDMKRKGAIFNDRGGNPIDLDKYVDVTGIGIKATGNPNEYVLSPMRYRPGAVGSEMYEFPQSGTLQGSRALGPTPASLPRTTTRQQPTNVIDTATKRPIVATLHSQQTVTPQGMRGGVPGQNVLGQLPFNPQPYQEPVAAPAPPPGAQGQPSEEIINFLMKQNPTRTREQIIAAVTGAGPTTAGGSVAAAATGQTAPVTPPVAPVPTPQQPRAGLPPPSFGDTIPGLAPGEFKRQQDISTSGRPAATILFGDEKNPGFESLASFGHLMNDTTQRDNIGNAIRLITKTLGEADSVHDGAALSILGTSISLGSIGQALKNHFGVTQWVNSTKGRMIDDAMQQVAKGPNGAEAMRMINRMMAAYGTIMGFRKFTGASGLKFSTDKMDQELPIPGQTGVINSATYYNKLASLAEELVSATTGFDQNLLPERAYWEGQAKLLTALGKGANVMLVRDPVTGQYIVTRRR